MIEANLGPLTLKADLSYLERVVRIVAEESLLTIIKARPAKLNEHLGILRLGGGLWYKIVFIPDDQRYLGRCFLDVASKEKAEQEYEELCKILKV